MNRRYILKLYFGVDLPADTGPATQTLIPRTSWALATDTKLADGKVLRILLKGDFNGSLFLQRSKSSSIMTFSNSSYIAASRTYSQNTFIQDSYNDALFIAISEDQAEKLLVLAKL